MMPVFVGVSNLQVEAYILLQVNELGLGHLEEYLCKCSKVSNGIMPT